MKVKNPVSADDALVFDEFVAQWKQRLNLADWRIERGTKPAKAAMASVEFNAPARLATYRLGDFGAEAITPESLERTALHELLHVFLYDLIEIACSKHDPDDLEATEHKIINVLEGLLMDYK